MLVTARILDAPVDDLNLTVRHQVALKEKGLRTIGDIVQSDFRLIAIRRYRVHRQEVDTAIAEYIGRKALAIINPERYKEVPHA
ncbi:MAG: hypothetical protein JWM46_357 [Candidatus Kaiserbacteria bacterium]|nr:hypothetical protein [Candidatus Kaiserbacteria bacterium]